MKVFVLMWHWIESDGVSGVFTSREEAESFRARAAGKEAGTSIYEMELDQFYSDEELNPDSYK